MNVWNNMQGEAKGSLTFHTQNIMFIGGGKSNTATINEGQNNVTPTSDTKDDLPF
jgi:hypothetical protein